MRERWKYAFIDNHTNKLLIFCVVISTWFSIAWTRQDGELNLVPAYIFMSLWIIVTGVYMLIYKKEE